MTLFGRIVYTASEMTDRFERWAAWGALANAANTLTVPPFLFDEVQYRYATGQCASELDAVRSVTEDLKADRRGTLVQLCERHDR